MDDAITIRNKPRDCTPHQAHFPAPDAPPADADRTGAADNQGFYKADTTAPADESLGTCDGNGLHVLPHLFDGLGANKPRDLGKQWRVVFEDQGALHGIDSKSVQIGKPTAIFSVGHCIAEFDEGEFLSQLVGSL